MRPTCFLLLRTDLLNAYNLSSWRDKIYPPTPPRPGHGPGPASVAGPRSPRSAGGGLESAGSLETCGKSGRGRRGCKGRDGGGESNPCACLSLSGFALTVSTGPVSCRTS
jgi:hypothetical protein